MAQTQKVCRVDYFFTFEVLVVMTIILFINKKIKMDNLLFRDTIYEYYASINPVHAFGLNHSLNSDIYKRKEVFIAFKMLMTLCSI